MSSQFSKAEENSGFREVEHTADWELEVWAPDMAGLLTQAMRGMYALSGVKLAADRRTERVLELEAEDIEGLLVEFLNELLFVGETKNLAFDRIQLELNGLALRAMLGGAPIESQTKEIKAVTYHRLEVRQSGSGLQVNIIFDV